MQPIPLFPDHHLYPEGVSRFLQASPLPVLTTLGDRELLAQPLLGLVCSVALPGSILLETYDFAKKVSSEGWVIVGGFHSPMERQVLEVLLARHVPAIVCVARRLGRRSIPVTWKSAVEEKRLLLVSPFPDKRRRVTCSLAHQRNRLVVAMSREVLAPFAATGGKTEKIVREALVWKKPVWSSGVDEEDEKFALGVQETDARTLATRLA